MFGSAILETAIGLIFVFALVSLLCSAIREGIEAWLKTRAAYLERGIRLLLHDVAGTGLARHVYEHPLIYGLYGGRYAPGAASDAPRLLAGGGELPSYIPAGNFATALLDVAARGPELALASDPAAPVLSLQSVRDGVWKLQNEPVQRVVLAAVDSAQGRLDLAKRNLEAWFDSGMDRVSGWYRRSTQWILFWIGLIVAVGLNVNTITIAQYLYRNDAERAAIVARAEAAAAGPEARPGGYEAARQELAQLRLPIGWSGGWALRRPDEGGGVWNLGFVPLLGWLVTALAATMGAPFWFDLLNKVMVIRSTVKPREKSPEEGSEDRQPKGAPAAAAQLAVLPVAPGAPAAPAAPAPPPAPAPLEDACDIPIMHVTRDEDLPEARGGVA